MRVRARPSAHVQRRLLYEKINEFGLEYPSSISRLANMKRTLGRRTIMESILCGYFHEVRGNRPTHEVLFSNDKDIAREYNTNFIGMTREPVKLSTLLEDEGHCASNF